jgi:putative acetyltransferase
VNVPIEITRRWSESEKIAHRHNIRGQVVTEDLRIRSANPTDADELLAIRRDAIMALAEEYGRVAAERWANAAHPDRAAKAIATNSVWVAESESKVVGWVEVGGATIESLYVSPAAARLGVGSSLLIHAEREIRDAGASIAYLDASPNAEAFYARRGYRRVGEVKANNSVPMSKRLEPQSRLTSRLSGPA